MLKFYICVRLKRRMCVIRRDSQQCVCACATMCREKRCVLAGVFISTCFHLSVRASVCVGVMSDASLLSIANRIVMVTEHILYHLPCN